MMPQEHHDLITDFEPVLFSRLSRYDDLSSFSNGRRTAEFPSEYMTQGFPPFP